MRRKLEKKNLGKGKTFTIEVTNNNHKIARVKLAAENENSLQKK